MAHTYTHDFDPQAERAGYIPGTDYALPYLSRFSVAHQDETAMLRHVNCSLLSTPGVPPTLLALKQHAQSLSYLIAMLEPHGGDEDAVEVLIGLAAEAKNNRGQARPIKRRKTGKGSDSAADTGSLKSLVAGMPRDAITDNPFDWLDLSRPYTNPDPGHHFLLLDLINEVQARHDVLGTTYHCPLTTYKPRNGGRYTMKDQDGPGGGYDDDAGQDEHGADSQRPYASHHNLLMHANMCLERLDHEYAATGGLLSLLPTDIAPQATTVDESAAMTAARNTLLGQWLVFTQQLVNRAHELEAAHANAVHILSGDAEHAPAVAGEDGGNMAASGERPRHWVLSNAGEDVWSAVHDKLDQIAAADTAALEQRRAAGVVGERSVTPSAAANVLPYVDLVTRFYRPPSTSRGPISVCLAGVPSIRDVAATSTASAAAAQAAADIAASAPLVSASVLEKRYNHRLEEAARLARDNTRLAKLVLTYTARLGALRQAKTRVETQNAALQTALQQAEKKLLDKSTPSANGATGETRHSSRRHRSRGAADSTYQYLPGDESTSEEE